MDRRKELGKILKQLSNNRFAVYYQAPGKQTMTYPCIIYKFTSHQTTYSGNQAYTMLRRYSISVITKDIDDDVYLKICELPTASLETRFVEDGLHHTIITLYY